MGQPLHPGRKGLVTCLYTTCSGGYVTVNMYYLLCNHDTTWHVRSPCVVYAVHSQVCGTVVCILHNYITCINLIGAALLTAAEQVTYRRVTRPFLPGWRGWPARLIWSLNIIVHILEAHLFLDSASLCLLSLSLLQFLTAGWLPWPPLPFDVLRWIVAWLPWLKYLEAFCPPFLFQFQLGSRFPFDILRRISMSLGGLGPSILEAFCPPFLFEFHLGCLSFWCTGVDCRLVALSWSRLSTLSFSVSVWLSFSFWKADVPYLLSSLLFEFHLGCLGLSFLLMYWGGLSLGCLDWSFSVLPFFLSFTLGLSFLLMYWGGLSLGSIILQPSVLPFFFSFSLALIFLLTYWGGCRLAQVSWSLPFIFEFHLGCLGLSFLLMNWGGLSLGCLGPSILKPSVLPFFPVSACCLASPNVY